LLICCFCVLRYVHIICTAVQPWLERLKLEVGDFKQRQLALAHLL
jgi:hypothetical protein